MFYTLSIGAFVIMLLPLAFIFLKPRYSNVFEEIYHDEYHHATTSFLRTNSTLNRIPEMEVNKTGGAALRFNFRKVSFRSLTYRS